MSWIIVISWSESLELFALELRKKLWFFFVYSLASTNINQSALNLVKIYVTIRSQMSLIMDLIRPELISLELEKTALIYFIYILASANMD